VKGLAGGAALSPTKISQTGLDFPGDLTIPFSPRRRAGTMLLIRTYVAQSAIEGVGVFAAEPIRKGALIWRLDPDFDRLIPMDKYEAASPHLRELLDRYAYPSPDRPGFMVYEVDNGRFMNHSERPNTDFSQYGGATATSDIAVGEEITCDYGEFFEDFARLHLATA
jgi:SET domain-containing protein